MNTLTEDIDMTRIIKEITHDLSISDEQKQQEIEMVKNNLRFEEILDDTLSNRNAAKLVKYFEEGNFESNVKALLLEIVYLKQMLLQQKMYMHVVLKSVLDPDGMRMN